jgi:hypothetical protein
MAVDVPSHAKCLSAVATVKLRLACNRCAFLIPLAVWKVAFGLQLADSAQ